MNIEFLMPSQQYNKKQTSYVFNICRLLVLNGLLSIFSPSSRHACFFAQKSGERLALFVARAMEAIVVSRLSRVTKWTGLPFHGEGNYYDGTPLGETRQHKKTFQKFQTQDNVHQERKYFFFHLFFRPNCWTSWNILIFLKKKLLSKASIYVSNGGR